MDCSCIAAVCLVRLPFFVKTEGHNGHLRMADFSSELVTGLAASRDNFLLLSMDSSCIFLICLVRLPFCVKTEGHFEHLKFVDLSSELTISWDWSKKRVRKKLACDEKYIILEIKPCWLGSGIRDAEAF